MAQLRVRRCPHPAAFARSWPFRRLAARHCRAWRAQPRIRDSL